MVVIYPFKLLFTSSQPRRLRPKSQLLSVRLKAAGKLKAAGHVSVQQCVLWLLVVDDLCGSCLDPKDDRRHIFSSDFSNKVLVVETLAAPHQQRLLFNVQ